MITNQKQTSGRVTRIWQAILVVLVALVIGWLGVFGMFAPVDSALRNLRFQLDNRATTGEIVLVEIDPKSLNSFGVWPWPRQLHAQMIDALVDYGAHNIAFDIDFSARSNPEDDAAMAAALDRAGGFVILAAFAQQDQKSGEISSNLPIDQFLSNAWLASVNVAVDDEGRVCSFPHASPVGDQMIASLPVILTGSEASEPGDFTIDFSIDKSQIDRMSFVDVLNGDVDRNRIAGKNIIIGAGAVELRDNFAVPRYGTITGPMLQVLAAETLVQSRQLQALGPIPGLVIIGLLGLLFIIQIRRLNAVMIVIGIVKGILILEISSFVLQSKYGLLFDTGAIHVAQFALVFGFLTHELDRRLGLFNAAARERAATQAILDQVITDNFDGVIVVDQTNIIRIASRLAEAVLKSSDNQKLVGSKAKDILPPELWNAVAAMLEDHTSGQKQKSALLEYQIERNDGEPLFIEYVVTRSTIEGLKGKGNKLLAAGQTVCCLTFRDITERRRSAKELEYLAHHDPLTGALNRTKLALEIEEALNRDGAGGKGVTVGIVDLRRFKMVNDTLGHSVGDQLLQQVVDTILASDVGLVARVGGDSFAFARRGIMTPEELEQSCLQLIKNVCEPYMLGEHRVFVGANVGVTDSAASGESPDMLLAHADMALSVAENDSTNSFAVYSTDMDKAFRRKQDVESALRHALAHDELWLAYQPQIELCSGKLIGVEALVRWTHPKWGLVTPDQFIPVAEETGLIVELGRFVLRRACKDAANWPTQIKVAVNVSPLQFEYSDVVEDVERALSSSGLTPDWLDIEITEGSFVEHSESIIAILNLLRSRGIGVALDDFGTGYSTLSYLGRLPIDKIKIDQSFVQKLPNDKEAGAIVGAVLALASALDKTVVAEGIEELDQAKFLDKAGCQIGQGYYYAKPMANAELIGFINASEGEALLKASAV